MNRFGNWARDLNGIQGYKRSYSISARIGKHYCPRCETLLKVSSISKIVNSGADVARLMDFSFFGEGHMSGNIQFIGDVYYCTHCNGQISIRDQRKFEKEQKKLKKLEKRSKK